jgi:F420-non-reducing hydrogenase iron-sulfur subunit
MEAFIRPSTDKILVLATTTCAYPGADTVGQAHIDYPANVYVLAVPDPVVFPEDFYLRCFERGIAGIIVMSCGTDCPYEGAYQQLARRVDGLYRVLQSKGIDPRRLRLTTICTVCTAAFLKEVNQMNAVLQEMQAA